ncbi:hypothetical protein BDN72DRAFT_282383 [Pluteus cervinus]|uniref:Uncharacterized protein n=1 Tax=Pluteus cervinus TaxID=181527 RepID=A0ACD3B4I4_9AGAR|nr:hypothetical protein BDN72DRAFT_282383 [Pluteus cervinus]
MLHYNVSYLHYYCNTARSPPFLDLAIKSLYAVRAFAQDRCNVNFPLAKFCRFLFIRSALLEGTGPFVDDAFNTLRELGGMILEEGDEDLTQLLSCAFHVLGKQQRLDYADIALQVLPPALCALATRTSGPRSREVLELSLTASDAFSAFPGFSERKEMRSISDVILPLISIYHPEEYGALLIQRTTLYAEYYRQIGHQDCNSDWVTATIEQTRAYLVKHENLKTKERALLKSFFGAATIFFCDWIPRSDNSGLVTKFTRLFTFLTWAIPYVELKLHTEGALLFTLQCVKAYGMMHMLLRFLRLLHLDHADGNRGQVMKEFVQVIYGGAVELEGNDIKFLEEQMLYTGDRIAPKLFTLVHGITKGTTYTLETLVRCCSSPTNIQEEMVRATRKMEAIVEYSISTEPHDEITLLRVIFAASVARGLSLPIAVKAYQYFMSSAELWAFTMLPLYGRQLDANKPVLIASDAISYALESNHHDLALEWVDQCLSIVWGQILHLQSSFAQVALVKPEVAKDLAEIASQLIDSQTIETGSMTTEQVVHHFGCALRWENAIKSARKLPGLDRFLKPKTFSEIQAAVDALGGPVAYFNINRYSCDALCVLPGLGEMVHIPLPGLRLREVDAIASGFRRLIRGTGREEVSLERIGKLVKNPTGSDRHLKSYVPFPTVLAYLWDKVVKPVLQGLAIHVRVSPTLPIILLTTHYQRAESKSVDDLPRIWWCPSGPLSMLPLHAAGHYSDSAAENILDYVVSSYIPSASIISHITRPESPTPLLQFLVVADPEGCGLPGTQRDLDVVRKYVVDAPLTELVGKSATPGKVVEELKAATWVHFACHGAQDVYPARSALILANRTRLKITELTKLSLPQAQFAFLAACQTAKGTAQTSNESAHLTGGMLVAGYRSVIGTMWRISDYYAPDIADRFYAKMFEGSQVPDYKRAAFALHDAVKTLRRDKNLDFVDWVPFIHAGA